MKKTKRILALAGVILLVGLYIITLVFAITDNSGTLNIFFASVVATVIIPVLIWTYTFIYHLIHSDKKNDSEDKPS